MITALLVFNPITLLILYIIYTKTTGIYRKLIMLLGAIVDVVVNLTWFTIIFWDWRPKEWLLTQRIERLKKYDGYRGVTAGLLCNLLNFFEAGHCV